MTAAHAADAAGEVSGAVRVWLRLEGLTVLVAAVLAYGRLDGGWLRFALLFLVPDLSMLAYLAGPRIGAAAYNALHSYVGPLLLGIAGVLGGASDAVALALVWIAHIGFDRVLGYGLKYPTAFQRTHLGTIGRRGA